MPTLAWLVGDADTDLEGLASGALVRVLARLHFPPPRDVSGVNVANVGAGDFSDGHAPNVERGPVTSQPSELT